MTVVLVWPIILYNFVIILIVKKIIVLNILILLAACGPSQEEKKVIAKNACAIMSETKMSDSLFRIQTMVDAREKIKGEAFIRGDEAIIEAFEFGICPELVLNESYDEILLSLKNAKRERERIAAEKLAEEKRIAAEKQRIADSKPSVKEEFYGNGKLKSRTNYQPFLNGGKKHGLYEYYHENGKLRETANYKDGKFEGDFSEYFESGQLMRKGYFKNGEADGVFEEYYENGRLKDRIIYKNGKREGLYETYYENMQLKQQVVYKNGKLEGDLSEYTERGMLKERTSYKNGKRDGPYISYWTDADLVVATTGNDDMIIKEDGRFKNGKRDGRFRFYRNVGSSEYAFKGIRKNERGTDTHYMTNEGYFLNGDFYPLQNERNYKNGLLHGVTKFYHSYNYPIYVMNETEYKNGKRDGITFFWGTRDRDHYISKCYKNDEEIIMSYCKK